MTTQPEARSMKAHRSPSILITLLAIASAVGGGHR